MIREEVIRQLCELALELDRRVYENNHANLSDYGDLLRAIKKFSEKMTGRVNGISD